MSSTKRLAVFDFDNTITSNISDLLVIKLLPKELIKPYTGKQLWLEFLNNNFQLLKDNQIDETKIRKTILGVTPLEGMCELIKKLVEELDFDVIIISDTNAYYINMWLAEYKIADYVLKVFANYGKFENGKMHVGAYRHQEKCKLSEKSLCKGEILNEFIKSQLDDGKLYKKVIFVGDGRYDACPMLELKEGDLVFCRDGYECAKIIQTILDDKPVGSNTYKMKANVFTWKTGYDIFNVIIKI